MRVTTEDLFGVSVDATPEQRSNLRLDVGVPKGTPLLRCRDMGDRWRIVVSIEGKRTSLITFRNPLGVTRGERLGPRFALAGKVKLKVARGKVPKGAKGAIVGYWGLERYQVQFGTETMTIDGKHITPCAVERATGQKAE